MSLTYVKNAATRQLADDTIGAAQALERAAKRLKDDAGRLRAHGVLVTEDGETGAIQNLRGWRAHTVKGAVREALCALQVEEA